MSVIIAPTHGYKRRPIDKQVNDNIIDPNGQVDIEQKSGKIVPKLVSVNTIEQKIYNNMQVIKEFNARNDRRYITKYFVDLEQSHHNGVAFPETEDDSRNRKYLLGDAAL